MSEIIIKQGSVTAHLHELHYQPAEAEGRPATITAEADQPLADGPAEISFQGKTLAVILEVFLADEPEAETPAAGFDPDDEDLDEYRSVCDLGLRPARGKLIQLAFNLGLLEGFSREHQKALLENGD